MRFANNRSEYLATVFVAGVGLIMLVHYLRDNFHHSPAVSYILGSAPNFIAGFSLPVVFICTKQRIGRLAGRNTDGPWFLGSTLLALSIVIAWELRQLHLDQFVFDLSDISASVLGAILFLCCWPLVRRFMSSVTS